MDNKKKLMIAGGVLAVVILIGYFASTSSDNDAAKNSPAGGGPNIFTSRTTTTSFQNNNTSTSTTPKTTRPGQTPAAAKAKLNELPLAAYMDPYYPELYLSFRYEIIINGEFQGDEIQDTYLYDKIAITELDDPNNSDLDATTFSQLRTLGIDVARAQATGVNTASYPTYFKPGVYADKCTNFSPVAAGAISMPYENDPSWAMAVVYWKATCSLDAKGEKQSVITSHQNVYFQRVAGGFNPVPVTAIPRTNL